MVYNINAILLNHDINSFNISGFRLNTTVYAKIATSDWADCAIECVRDPCCRSVNYKTLITAGNEENCEMLHNLVYNTSDDLLKKNGTYNYIFLNSPMKVKTLILIILLRIIINVPKLRVADWLRAAQLFHQYNFS